MTTADPRCPHCDGPVSATSSYCMHCGGDVDAVAGSWANDADASDEDDYTRPGGGVASTGTTDSWLDPDGPLDDVSTVLVASVAAVLVGGVSVVVGLLLTQSLLALLVLPVAMGLVGLWVGRNRSVFGAVRKGCYATATALVLVPTVALGPSAKGGTFAGQVLLFLIAEIPFGLGALLLVGVGYWAGKRRPVSTSN